MDIRIKDGAPLQLTCEAFVDAISGLLLGADHIWLHRALLWMNEPAAPQSSNYPPGVQATLEGQDFEDHPLDPVYLLLRSDDERLQPIFPSEDEPRLLGAYAAWQFVDLWDALQAGSKAPDFGALDPLLQRINMAIVRGYESALGHHIEATVGAAERKRIEAARAQSRSLAQRRWSKTNQHRELAVELGLQLQETERSRAGTAKKLVRMLHERTNAVYEQKTIDRWLKDAGWTSKASK